MANQAFTQPAGAYWPLGQLTVASGTPVIMSHNVGSQLQSPTNFLGSNKMRGFIISVPGATANTGDIYVMKGNNPYTSTNCVVAIIKKGDPPITVPQFQLTGSNPSPDDLYIDGTHTGDTCQVCAIVG